MHKKIKQHALDENTSIKDIIHKAIEEYLKTEECIKKKIDSLSDLATARSK